MKWVGEGKRWVMGYFHINHNLEQTACRNVLRRTNVPCVTEHADSSSLPHLSGRGRALLGRDRNMAGVAPRPGVGEKCASSVLAPVSQKDLLLLIYFPDVVITMCQGRFRDRKPPERFRQEPTRLLKPLDIRTWGKNMKWRYKQK